MKSKNIAAVTIAIGLGFSGLVLADPPGAPASPTPRSTPQAKTISGSVTNIDQVNHTIQVKDTSGAIQTLVMNPDVEVTKDGQPTTLNDLKVGDVVTVKVAYNNPNS